MLSNIEKHIANLKKDGITVIENQFTIQECETYISKFEEIVNNLKSNGAKLNSNCQLIRNPYRHNIELTKLIYNKTIDDILKIMIDKDYVMINSTLINRKIDTNVNNKGDNMGSTWHTDSHYVGGQRLDKGFTFIAVTLFDEFSEKNGGTLYIPGSQNRREIPNRDGYDNEKRLMSGPRGSIILFDGGIWHKGGPATDIRRWSMFTYYGPWFVKPYYRFPEMLGEKFGKNTTKELRRLFHYNSTPPLNEDFSVNTVIKER